MVIIDYKTGKTPAKNKSDIDQLHIYQWAAEELLKEKVMELKYWYLRTSEFAKENLADKLAINDLKSRLLKTIEEIIEAIKYDSFKVLHAKKRDHNCEFEMLE